MPTQGQVKWTTQFVSDKDTVVDMLEKAYIQIDQLGSYESEIIMTVAPYFIKDIAGTLASLGGSVVSMALSTFKTKCKSQILSCIDDLVGVPSGREVAIMAKYMWTEKEGGNWMPKYEIKHLIVESV